LLAELNNIIRNKDDEINDLKNLVYRHSDDAEKLIKALQDADMQLVECVTRIRDTAVEKELKDKELQELKGAAQVVVGRSGERQDVVGATSRNSPKDYQLHLENHQDLRGARPWNCKVLLAQSQPGATSDWNV
jgi:phosphotransferase system IIB component